MKRFIKALAARYGYEIVRSRNPCIDLDPFVQQQRLLAGKISPLIMDVGAHVGETSRIYAEKFPASRIHAFEPFADSFYRLTKNMFSYSQVRSHQVGLADRNESLLLNVNAFDATNSLLATDRRATSAWGMNKLETREQVSCRFMTIDMFMIEQTIEKIDILKIDAQGAEYKVLLGATKALDDGLIDIIFLEVIVAPTYEMQWSLSQYLDFMGDHNMALHGFYNFDHIGGRLRQLDAIFVRRRDVQSARCDMNQ